MFYQDIVMFQGITSDTWVFNAKDSSGNPVNLTGWTAFSGADNEIDLQPTITNPIAGQVTIARTPAQTALYPVGEFTWDLCFQDLIGERLGPYIGGKLTIHKTGTILP